MNTLNYIRYREITAFRMQMVLLLRQKAAGWSTKTPGKRWWELLHRRKIVRYHVKDGTGAKNGCLAVCINLHFLFAISAVARSI